MSLLVIHNISLPPGVFGGDEVERFFRNRLDPDEDPYFREIVGMKVSAHLLVRRGGELVQFVSVHRRAWHAGRSCFAGRDNCNDFAVGIELEGCDDQPYSDAQYRMLAQCCHQLLAEFPALDRRAIVGHSDVAPGRKTDPGPAFDWSRLSTELGDISSGKEA